MLRKQIMANENIELDSIRLLVPEEVILSFTGF